MGPSEIKARSRALRLKDNELAALAGVNVDTVCRVFGDKTDPLRSTLLRLGEAVEAAEIKMLQHLVQLHPDKAASAARGAA